MKKITNGRYIITQKSLGIKYILQANSGSLRVYDINSNMFIRRITEFYLHEFYDIEESKTPEENKLYNISWVVNGSIKEVIQTKSSYIICQFKVNQMQQTTHKIGKLIIKLIE